MTKAVSQPQDKTPNSEKKRGRGRPKKNGVMVAFYLASDVAGYLSNLNQDGGKGEATQFVEDAIREKAKLPKPPTKP